MHDYGKELLQDVVCTVVLYERIQRRSLKIVRDKVCIGSALYPLDIRYAYWFDHKSFSYASLRELSIVVNISTATALLNAKFNYITNRSLSYPQACKGDIDTQFDFCK